MNGTKPPYYAIQLFDQVGYYSTVTAPTQVEVMEAAAKRTFALKSLVACTVPFPGAWLGSVRDVSAPVDIKAAFAALDKTSE